MLPTDLKSYIFREYCQYVNEYVMFLLFSAFVLPLKFTILHYMVWTEWM